MRPRRIVILVGFTFCVFFASVLGAADPAEPKELEFFGLVRYCKKLADLTPTLELWASMVQSKRLAAETNMPEVITLISPVEKNAKRSAKYVGPLPEGTEIKWRLSRRADGSLETTYFYDVRMRSSGLY